MIKRLVNRGHAIYMTEMRLPSMILSKEDVAKIHVQLGHCSENTLITTIRADQMHCDLAVIQAVLAKRGCQTAVQRITLPVVASTMAKYNGEIIALGVIFHSQIVLASGFRTSFQHYSRLIHCHGL